jgi:orotidine-5'-phosphate decarboxylase
MTHFADRLTELVRQRGNPLCVGLDPRWESLPASVRLRHGGDSLAAVAAAYEEFCSRVIEIVAPHVAVVKPQAAFFEACGPDGLHALQHLLHKARGLGLLTILDGKRNDIASTATAYADAAFAGTVVAGKVLPVWQADALTVNPYLGQDAVEPFITSARRSGGGVFVLVRTSNPGAGLFQDLPIATGEPPHRPLYQHVGAAVARWSRQSPGECGLGDVGAVVGATYPSEMALLRREMPDAIFLVPGYGAQGGSAEDVRSAFRADGSGAVVNSSRGILFPFAPDESDWQAKILAATQAAVAQLAPLSRP